MTCCNDDCKQGRECPIRAAARLNAYTMDARNRYDRAFLLAAVAADPVYPDWLIDAEILIADVMRRNAAQDDTPAQREDWPIHWLLLVSVLIALVLANAWKITS